MAKGILELILYVKLTFPFPQGIENALFIRVMGITLFSEG